MSILIKSAKIIDASSKFNGKTKDIFIKQGIIQEINDKIVKKSIDKIHKNILRAKDLKVKYVSFHAGFLFDIIDKKISNGNELNTEINTNITFIKDSFAQYNRIDPNKNFDNFIVGPSNSLAFEASKKVTDDLLKNNIINELVETKHGFLVEAMVKLMENALKDKDNKFFVFISGIL